MKIKLLLTLLVFVTISLYPQYNGRKFSFSFNAVYTTTARLYLSPNSPEDFIRNSYFHIADIFDPAVDVRFALTDDIILGFGTEYMKKIKSGSNINVSFRNQVINIDVTDGFILIPLEFSVYYLIPFSTDHFKFLMGGGGAYYYGEHVRNFGDVEVSNVDRKAAYGIHVQISMDYLFRDNLSVRAEMKFRDPQFTVTSKYNKTSTVYKGQTITFKDTFNSKINVDGVTFVLGLAYHL